MGFPNWSRLYLFLAAAGALFQPSEIFSLAIVLGSSFSISLASASASISISPARSGFALAARHLTYTWSLRRLSASATLSGGGNGCAPASIVSVHCTPMKSPLKGRLPTPDEGLLTSFMSWNLIRGFFKGCAFGSGSTRLSSPFFLLPSTNPLYLYQSHLRDPYSSSLAFSWSKVCRRLLCGDPST